MNPQTAFAHALEKAGDPRIPEGIRDDLKSLLSQPVVEAHIEPVMSKLLKAWSDSLRGNEPLPLVPALFCIEGARLAEALRLLEDIPGQQAENARALLGIPFVKPAGDRLLVEGVQEVSQAALRQAAGHLQAARRQDLQPAIDLITAVANDCAGPLGAVYGIGI